MVQVLLSEGNKFRLELVTQGSGSSVQLECSWIFFFSFLYILCHLPFISLNSILCLVSTIHFSFSWGEHNFWMTMLVNAYNLSTWEAKAGASLVWSQIGFHSKTLSQAVSPFVSPIPSVLLPASPFSNFTTFPLHCQAVVLSCLQEDQIQPISVHLFLPP